MNEKGTELGLGLGNMVASDRDFIVVLNPTSRTRYISCSSSCYICII